MKNHSIQTQEKSVRKQLNSSIDKKIENGQAIFEQSIHILNEYQSDPLFQATQRLLNDADVLMQIAEAKKNCIHAQGWQFEQLEVMKFNMDAVQKEQYGIFAQTTDSMGQPHAAADILIKNTEGTVLREAQLKSCNDAAKSAFALADEKYEGIQRIAPSEQTEKISELYQKRIEAGTLKAQDYQDAQNHLEKGVQHGEITSGGTTQQEAIDATDLKHAEQIASAHKQEALLTELHRTGHQAGVTGAVIGGGISIIGDGYQILSGKSDLTVSEFLLKTTTHTVKGYTTSYVTSVAARGVVHTTQEYLAESTAKALIKSNAHIAVAAGAVKAGKSIYRFLTDENMTKEELYNEINHTALTGAGAFYYGAVGQALIPIPIIGALVGSTVGYFMANVLHQSGLFALGEAARVKVARERKEQIEQLCLAVIPQMRAARLEMEQILEENRIARQVFIADVFSQMEDSILSVDADQYIQALNRLNGAFGHDLGFKNFEEFDQLMQDDDFVFQL